MIFDAVWSKENLYGAEPRKILKKIAFADENKYENSLKKIKEINALNCHSTTLDQSRAFSLISSSRFFLRSYNF